MSPGDARPARASASQPREEIHSYHGQPIIKEPVWTWEIPCYFFTGGMAGASAGLAWGSGLRGNRTLARRAWAVSLASVTASPMLLVSDLGKPVRFLNMLRMFKVTSPMSVGSWILSVSSATTALATVNAWTGLFPASARVARPLAALFGLPLSTYTAALITNTAVPVWHEAREGLPFIFASGAGMSAGAAAVALTPTDHARAARRLALASAAAELALEKLMEERLGDHAEPYEQGLPHRLNTVARATTVAGAALLARAGGRSRVAAAAGGGLLLAGALATRWSIFKAGFVSASDPKYVVAPQRARIEKGESSGASRREPRVSAPQRSAGSPAVNV